MEMPILIEGVSYNLDICQYWWSLVHIRSHHVADFLCIIMLLQNVLEKLSCGVHMIYERI